MEKQLILLLLFFLNQACFSQEGSEHKQLRLIGRCDGCEGVFEYGNRALLPVDTLPGFDQYQPKLKLTGTIYKPDGKTPAPNVVMYIYQTNTEGKYPKVGNEKGWAKMHGYIRGWIKTDSSGKYTFYTFQPGSYGTGPAHIHAIVLEPDGRYYFIDDFNFKGDPNLGTENNNKKQGGPGIVDLKREGSVYRAERNIILGLNIPKYE